MTGLSPFGWDALAHVGHREMFIGCAHCAFRERECQEGPRYVEAIKGARAMREQPFFEARKRVFLVGGGLQFSGPTMMRDMQWVADGLRHVDERELALGIPEGWITR